MAIRVMVWNIERFGQNKLGLSEFDQVSYRRNYIVSTIAQVNPDILAIIEVQSAQQNGVGSLISDSSGGPGVRTLRDLLPGQSTATGAPWGLVPPLLLNVNISRKGNNAYSEGAAVFFRKDKLDFTGPYKWTGSGSTLGAQPISRSTAAAAYGSPWDTCLPATQPYGGAPALNQNQLAGQPIFYDGAATPQQIVFGDQPLRPRLSSLRRSGRTRVPDIFTRNPWLTTFIENTGTNRGRVIKLWTVHLPPSFVGSRIATASLARIPEVSAALGDAEVRVIAGDFNVDALDPRQVDVFRQLTNAQMVLNTGAATNLYTRWFAERTMMESVSDADVGGDGPFYAYTKRKALDNILTAYGAAAGAPANPRVVNRVVGTPRQDVRFPPAAVYSVALGTNVPTIRALPFSDDAKGELFRSLNNFGQVGGKLGASDHTAVVLDL